MTTSCAHDENLCPFAGLAKPAPVIETFCSDELVSQYVKLDGVVTLVDCKHAMQHLNEVKPRFVVNEAVEQVAYADRIILNKVSFLPLDVFFFNFVYVPIYNPVSGPQKKNIYNPLNSTCLIVLAVTKASLCFFEFLIAFGRSIW